MSAPLFVSSLPVVMRNSDLYELHMHTSPVAVTFVLTRAAAEALERHARWALQQPIEPRGVVYRLPARGNKPGGRAIKGGRR